MSQAPLQADASFNEARGKAPLTLTGILASSWRRRLVFLATFACCVGSAGFVITSLQPRYEADALLMVEPRQTNIANLQSVMDEPAKLADLNFVRSQMQILTSDDLARRVVEDLHLQDNPAFAAQPSRFGSLLALLRRKLRLPEPKAPPARPIDAAVARYRERLGAFSDGKSFIITASFSAPDPDLARQVLDRHLSLFQDSQVAAKRRVIEQAENWFAGQLETLHAKLLVSESERQAFLQANQLLKAGGETVTSRQLAAVTNQLTDARSDLARKAARLREMTEAGSTARGPDTAVLSSELMQRLRQQEAVAAQQIAQEEQRYGASYPVLAEAKAGLADLQARISREAQRLTASAATDVAIAGSNVQRLEHSLDELSGKLASTSKGELTAAQLDRDIEADRHLYDDLLLRSKQVSIQGQLQEADTRIVSAATRPLSVSFPRTGMLLAIAAMGAIVAGALAAFAADLLGSGRAASLSNMEAECGAAGLAVIPRLGRKQRRVTSPVLPGTHLAAALQTLKNSVAFRCPSRSPAVTLFTSALPGEGKTLLATQYASSLAADGHRVLLIDADLRRFGLTLNAAGRGHGLTDVLRGRPLPDCVVASQVPGMDILHTGATTADPGTVLASSGVRYLLSAASATYAAVVIDTAPVAVVDDALHLVAQADATVLVARWNRTPVGAIRRALGRLRLSGGNVVGVALTATDMRRYRSDADTPQGFSRYRKSYLAKS